MKTIDIFSNVLGQVAQDSLVQQYGAILVTSGATGLASLNPTAVWVDAALSVIEAAGSYFRFCAAEEVTQKLRECNRVLEATLAHELQIADLQLKALCEQRKGRLAHVERTIEATRRDILLSQKNIRSQLELFKRMRLLLQQERLQSGGFRELIGLQVCLDRSIDATLALLLRPTGEHP